MDVKQIAAEFLAAGKAEGREYQVAPGTNPATGKEEPRLHAKADGGTRPVKFLDLNRQVRKYLVRKNIPATHKQVQDVAVAVFAAVANPPAETPAPAPATA